MREAGYTTRAVRAYKLGIRLLDGSVSVAPAADCSSYKANPDAQNLFITLLLNASLCLLRLVNEQQSSSSSYLSLANSTKAVRTDQLMRPCIAACQKAIHMDPNNAKAWFRMAQAYAALHDYEEACQAGERSLTLLDPASKTQVNATASPLSRTQVSGLLASWRSLAASQRRRQRDSVRRAFLRRIDAIQRGEYPLGEEGDGSTNVEISQWSNDMADNMMSLHEELEAFGETMPEPARKVRIPKDTKCDSVIGNRPRLTRIEDAPSEDSNDE
ncbi:unnamed protein product [Schistocephalus solidus]|uniref:TPR_REGION domain-containing protein n=1 Tax=Schistocephalus solidus TaxID=70667 RepID=A0A183SW58_SCHSO|nr:unnamed protein product [Schistocephalus solidus]